MSAWQIDDIETGKCYIVSKVDGEGMFSISDLHGGHLFDLKRSCSDLINCEKSMLAVIKLIEQKNKQIDLHKTRIKRLKSIVNQLVEIP